MTRRLAVVLVPVPGRIWCEGQFSDAVQRRSDISATGVPIMVFTRFEVRETTRFASQGACIYCGSSDDLTDEHVVPYGLGGKMILPKSSCRRCAMITGQFEGKVLRGFMRDGRAVA